MSKGVSAGFPSNNVGIKAKIWRQQHTCKPSPRQVWQSLRTTLNSNGTYFTKCLNNNYTINSNGNLSNPSVFRAVTWCHTILYYTDVSEARSAFPVCLLGAWGESSRVKRAWMNLLHRETRKTVFIPSCWLQLCSLQFLWLPKPSTWVVSKSFQNLRFSGIKMHVFRVFFILSWKIFAIPNCPNSSTMEPFRTIPPQAFEISGCGFAKTCLMSRKADASREVDFSNTFATLVTIFRIFRNFAFSLFSLLSLPFTAHS